MNIIQRVSIPVTPKSLTKQLWDNAEIIRHKMLQWK